MRKKIAEPFKVGQIVYFTTGIYSDYIVMGVFKVVKDFTEKTVESIKDEIQEEIKWYELESSIAKEFLKRGFLEELDSREININEGGFYA